MISPKNKIKKKTNNQRIEEQKKEQSLCHVFAGRGLETRLRPNQTEDIPLCIRP